MRHGPSKTVLSNRFSLFATISAAARSPVVLFIVSNISTSGTMAIISRMVKTCVPAPAATDRIESHPRSMTMSATEASTATGMNLEMMVVIFKNREGKSTGTQRESSSKTKKYTGSRRRFYKKTCKTRSFVL